MPKGLYDNGYLVFFNEGDNAVFRDFPDYRGAVSDVYHTILEGETLYDIARKYYGSSYYWYVLADANPDIIDDIFDLSVSETILIPNIKVP